MRGGALGAILWFELALFGALLAAAPIVIFGSALMCPSGADCGPGRALATLLALATGVGGAFLVAVVALDRAAGRWRPIAFAELLTGVALVGTTVAAAVWTVMDGD